MFKLAELFVQIGADDRQLKKGLSDVHAMLGGAATKLAALAGGIGAGAFFYKAVQGASNLQETLSKVGVVFGQSASEVEKMASQMAKDFGMPKNEMLDAASIFGLMAQGAGLAQDASAGFSNQMTKLAADAASFYNVPITDALQKIRSGLSGEAEPLRAFGVFLSEAAMQAKAAEMGIGGLHGKLNEGEKILVRQQLITEGLAKAQGDLARTSQGTANQQRKLMGDLTNGMAEFGAAVMPIWNGVLDAAVSALSGINGWLTESKDGITTWASTIGGYLAAAGVLFRNWDIAVQITAISFGEKMINMEEMVSWFVDSATQYATWFANNWYNVIYDALNAVYTAFQNIFTNIVNLAQASYNYITNPAGGFNFQFTGLLDGFKSTMEQLPEIAKPHLTSLQNQIDELTTKMGDAEVARVEGATALAASAATGAVARASAVATPGGGKETKSTTMGLEEFAKSLQAGVFGDKTAQESLAAQKAIAANTEKMAKQNPPPAVAVA